MAIFTPPDLFAAVANAARGDDDLPNGIHLRLMPSPGLGFPVMPFAIFAVQPRPAEPQVLWRNGRDMILPEPSLEMAEGVLVGDILPPSTTGDALDVAESSSPTGRSRDRSSSSTASASASSPSGPNRRSSSAAPASIVYGSLAAAASKDCEPGG